MALKTHAPMSAAKAAALAKAQAASLAQSEYGSPRERGLKRAHDAIEWIYKWGWSTPTVIEINAGSFRSGLANRLVKSGVLNRIETPSGGINNTPTFLLTLTKKGLEKAVEITDKLLPYETDPHRINLNNVTHDELVQRLTALKTWELDDSGIDEFITPKSLHAWNSNEIKIPDVVWKRKNAEGELKTFAVEFELTPKHGHEFDRFVAMTAELLFVKDSNAQNLFHGIEIYSKSPALIKRYSAAFAPGTKTQCWLKEKGKTGRWQKITDKNNEPVFFTATEKVSRAVKFTLITKEMIETPKSRA